LERKCPNCNTWSNNQDYCPHCKQAISSNAIGKLEEKNRVEDIAKRPPTKLDILVNRMKYSKYWLVRAGFYIGFSVWTIFMLILSFFMWLIALTPG
jgi:hypothetical protein